ncbi:MAG: phosphopantothenoylcysteine decarboxylase [Thaumarchaeota archaeon]|nr:phosphopantothenoylcysteine decarboxylase [Nitrososphaerota archaeon]
MTEGNTDLPCGNLLIGITGSVGALAVPHYLSLLRQSFAKEIHVMMSRAAQKFLSPYAMRLLSGHRVFTDSFQITTEVKVPHIELTRRADLFLIMPATANIIGKAANGICDDLISTSIVACQAPVVFVPSMNEVMWSNRAVQQNIQKLKTFGYYVLEPTCGYEITDMKQTFGAMPTFASILEQLKQIFVVKNG